jgi:GntP family gluconate:H+ symporter
MDFGPVLLGNYPGVIFAIAVILFVVLHGFVRWPLPLAFIAVAVVSAILGGFGIPFRHLVEGGFGFVNLALVLFGGAFFGHMMRVSGAADAAAAGIVKWTGGRSWLVLLAVGLPIFVVGMFSGLSGVAILSAGAFAVPALRRIGYDDATIAGFMAVIGVMGMIAPPTNVPAMLAADGVNMPWTGVEKALLFLSVPPALVAIGWFTWWGATQPPAVTMEAKGVDRAALIGLIPLAVIVLIWVITRWFGTVLIDPVSPLVLVIGGLCAVPLLMKVRDIEKAVLNTFTGTPLALGAVLVSVGIIVQIATLTGVRGWLVVSVMSLPYPWNLPSLLIGMPLIGGALTAIEASDILGVPAAFSYIGQNMILNVTSLSSIAALAEFVPPTAIAAALSCYMVGGGTIRSVIRRAWVPMLVMAVLAILMLVREIPPAWKDLLL